MRMKSLALLALTLLATPAYAQSSAPDPYDWFGSRLKFKGHHIFNRSVVNTEEGKLEDGKTGYGAGLEIVGKRIGVGLSGYTVGRVSEFDAESTELVVLAEVNYFVPIKVVRLAPYVGVHSGLGTYSKAYFDDPHLPKLQDKSIKDLGYQAGVRFQPLDVLALDAQFRRASASAAAAQSDSFERDQVVLGITIF